MDAFAILEMYVAHEEAQMNPDASEVKLFQGLNGKKLILAGKCLLSGITAFSILGTANNSFANSSTSYVTVIAPDGLRIRSEAKLNDNWVGSLSIGEVVKVIDCNKDDDWCRIVNGHRNRWISKKGFCLNTDNPCLQKYYSSALKKVLKVSGDRLNSLEILTESRGELKKIAAIKRIPSSMTDGNLERLEISLDKINKLYSESLQNNLRINMQLSQEDFNKIPMIIKKTTKELDKLKIIPRTNKNWTKQAQKVQNLASELNQYLRFVNSTVKIAGRTI